MANLTSIAQRLNDVEINNNAPVSSQTQRRVASSVNFLLDLVGAVDSATSTTGALGTILTPTQSISFSKAFGPADIGIDVPLFTYQGGGDRPIKFYVPDNGFCLAEIEHQNFLLPPQQVLASAERVNFYSISKFNYNPLLSVLYQLATIPNGTSGIFTVKVNGILMGTAARSTSFGPDPKITLSRDIIISPTGVNTLTVNSPTFTNMASPVVGNFNYIYL